MSKNYHTNIDLNQNQIVNMVVDKRATPPNSPISGQVYYNTITNKYYGYSDNNAWVEITGINTHYIHEQNIPSQEWIIIHNLGFHPNVVIENTAGDEVQTIRKK